MANILTGARILCGILLLCFPLFSPQYYVFLLLGGFTDAIDGTVARRLGQVSDFGARFDTAADLVFAAAIFVRLLRASALPAPVLICGGCIAAVKLAGIAVGLVKYRRFAAVHSALNKICGAAVYLAVLSLGTPAPERVKTAAVLLACVLAGIAAIREFLTILTGKTG